MLSEKFRKELLAFLKTQRSPELLTAYMFYLEHKLGFAPVVFVKEKIVYPTLAQALATLEKEGKLWRETEIKIGYGPPTVNEETKKIYICPFTGKTFGDNTHPNPQDAIYEWVAHCPENTERVGGLRSKRFFVSEDPEIIRNYIKPQKKPITKTVFSSAMTGKLFNSKEAVIEDFKNNYLKPIRLVEVQNQSRFQLEESCLSLISAELQEEKITAFVEALAEEKSFHPYVSKWVETEES